MSALTQYLDQIVDPTFEDFKRNPRSLRHGYLACLVVYHAIDRATYPKNPGNRRKEWRDACVQFTIVDMIAHKLKHVVSDDEKRQPASGIPLSSIIFGFGTRITWRPIPLGSNHGGIDVHNLLDVVQGAIAFLRKQAKAANQT